MLASWHVVRHLQRRLLYAALVAKKAAQRRYSRGAVRGRKEIRTWRYTLVCPQTVCQEQAGAQHAGTESRVGTQRAVISVVRWWRSGSSAAEL